MQIKFYQSFPLMLRYPMSNLNRGYRTPDLGRYPPNGGVVLCREEEDLGTMTQWQTKFVWRSVEEEPKRLFP